MEIRDHITSGKPAVVLARAGTVIDFAELEERANRLAHFWYTAGLREGDTVAVILENNEHVHAVMWAARRSGLYYALINTHLTAAEAAYIVDNSSAQALIGSRATRSVCEGLAEHLPGGLPKLLLIADDDLDGWCRPRGVRRHTRSEPDGWRASPARRSRLPYQPGQGPRQVYRMRCDRGSP